jgi:hypothetical protein
MVCAGLVAAGVAGAVAVSAGPSHPPPGTPSADTRPGAPAAVATPGSVPKSALPLRLLTIGDSEAITFTVDLSVANPPTPAAPGAGLFSTAVDGCGVGIVAQGRRGGVVGPPPAPCNATTPAAEQWPALVRRAIANDRINVLLLIGGRIETYDSRATSTGPWQNILQPQDAAYVKHQMELVAQIGIDSNVHVVLATAPFYSSGRQPDGQPWPEDNRARVRAYNHLVRQVAAAYPHQVSVLDMNALVCPGGKYQLHVDGVTVRSPDGIHYPFFNIADPNANDPDNVSVVKSFGEWLSSKIMPELEAAAG